MILIHCPINFNQQEWRWRPVRWKGHCNWRANVNGACSGKNVGNWQTASYCQVLSSWWLGEGKGKSAWATKCSSRTVGVLTHYCTTAAVRYFVLTFQHKIIHLCLFSAQDKNLDVCWKLPTLRTPCCETQSVKQKAFLSFFFFLLQRLFLVLALS